MTSQRDSILLNSLVGQNVQRLRKAAGLSQSELARELTLRGAAFMQQTVLKVEKGTRPLKLEEAAHIAEVLGVQVGDLLRPNADDEEAAALSQLLRARVARLELQQRVDSLKAELASEQQDLEHAQILEREAMRRLKATGWNGTLPQQKGRARG